MLILENKGMKHVVQRKKKGNMAELCIFISHLYKYWALVTIDSTKSHVVVEILVQIKVFHF